MVNNILGFDCMPKLKTQGANIIRYMKLMGYKIRALNIVYLEGINAKDILTLNDDLIDRWNDVRCIVTDKGDVLLSAQATTEPGWFYRKNRMNPRGAAQLAFGQYLDCWKIGKHYSQDALVQCGEISVFRDNNEDGYRKNDELFKGSDFYINQHTTGGILPDLVGRWSAGCLVGRYPETHKQFMRICRSMGLETFDTTLIDGSKFAEFSNNGKD